jgi:hypothetical protein
LSAQGVDPHPSVLGGLGNGLTATAVVRGDGFLGADHPHRLRVAKGDSFGLPELNLVRPPVLALFKLQVGRPGLKQPHGALVEVVPFEGAVGMHEHLLESGQVEPAQTVTQHIVAQRPRDANPVQEGKRRPLLSCLLTNAR